MKFFGKPITQVILFYSLIVLTAISLSGKSLLSLPFFYNQSAQQRLITFLIVALVFCVLVYFTSRVFILPYLIILVEWKNLVFIIVLTIFLSMLLGINSAPYWAFPEIHKVEICFDAQEGEENLRIEKLVEPSTNRLFPSDSFNQDRYPLRVPSGGCINGRLVYLPSLLTRALIIPRLSVIVDENPPAGRFFINANRSALLHQGFTHLPILTTLQTTIRVDRSGAFIVGENTMRTTKHAVLEGHAVINRDAVLDLDVIPDFHTCIYIDALTEDTIPSDINIFAHLAMQPNFCPLTNFRV